MESQYPDELWQEWLNILPKNSKASGNEEISLLENDFKKLNSELQQQLIEAMLHVVLNQGLAHWMALNILETKASIEHRREIFKLYKSKQASSKTWQDDWYLNDLIDALSFEASDEFVDAIKDYFLKRPFGMFERRPSLKLFKYHPDLFVRAWTRFFLERPVEDWHNSGNIQFLLWYPEAISAVKHYSLTNAPLAWKKFKHVSMEQISRGLYIPSEVKDSVLQIIES